MDGKNKNFDPKILLQKHGWKTGSGLGRNEHGIKDAIKVNMKSDYKGIGHDPGAEFTFHWWDHVYNSAANSIKVVDTEDGVKVTKLGDYELSVKKKQASLANKNMLYGRFIKSATLTNGGEEVKEMKAEGSESDDSEADDRGTASKFTDDELFQKLGGLTCHKAARHGHRLNGKLERLNRQEHRVATLVAVMPGQVSALSNVVSSEVQPVVDGEKRFPIDKEVKRKRRKTETESLDKDGLISNGCDKNSSVCKINESNLESDKKKSKRKSRSSDICDEIGDVVVTCRIESSVLNAGDCGEVEMGSKEIKRNKVAGKKVKHEAVDSAEKGATVLLSGKTKKKKKLKSKGELSCDFVEKVVNFKTESDKSDDDEWIEKKKVQWKNNKQKEMEENQPKENEKSRKEKSRKSKLENINEVESIDVENNKVERRKRKKEKSERNR